MNRTSLLLLGSSLMLFACPVEAPAPPDTDCPDADSDGFTACEECDDTDPQIFPGAPERCNGLDDDCDGQLPHEELDGDELQCQSCEDAGLFSTVVATTSADALTQVLHEATQGISCTYSNATLYMFTALDRDSGQVECVYTGRSVTVGAEKPDPTDMNTEHTWPQSWGADVIPAKCDLHHLFPSDAEANQVRADLPFGEVTSSTEWSQGGSSRGLSASGEAVFEPRDEHKGNVARAMLYFATRYQHSIDTHELNLYERWHSLDPVDIFELDRSLEILRRQGNINPYVACPFAVERLTDGD